MSSVLIVDDDFDAGQSLGRLLRTFIPDLEVQAVSSSSKALSSREILNPQVAIIDLCLDELQGVESGFSLLAQFANQDPSMRIIVLTGHADSKHGVRALQLGAASFLEKPADPSHLVALVKDALSQSQLRRAYTALRDSSERTLNHTLTGSSRVMQQLREEVLHAAQTNQPVLLLGETGTGKGVTARAIHEMSKRAKNPFVRYQPNFATIDLVNSEIFGHTKGSFTGAQTERLGLLHEAGQGTFFLDEVEELPLETQVALLGVFQEKVYRAVGANRENALQCRIVCATNEDPLSAIENGRLRRDFYHRLAHCVIQVPALRQRLDDIPELVEAILLKLQQREETSTRSISEDALQLLMSHSWPGNVRELEACIENAAYRAQFKNRSEVCPEDLKLNYASHGSQNARSFAEQVEHFKLKLINDALAEHGGNQLKAAKTLGLDRSTLRRILGRAE